MSIIARRERAAHSDASEMRLRRVWYRNARVSRRLKDSDLKAFRFVNRAR